MSPEEIIKKLEPLQVYILEDDIRLYHEVVSKMPKGSKILDLGTGWGKSVIAMAMCNPNVRITTYDSGRDPITFYNSFGDDIDEYGAELHDRFIEYGVRKQITAVIGGDLVEMDPPVGKYDLLHLDLSSDREAEILERWLSALKPGGFALVRNYKRFQEEADEILKDMKHIKYTGLINLLQKP